MRPARTHHAVHLRMQFPPPGQGGARRVEPTLAWQAVGGGSSPCPWFLGWVQRPCKSRRDLVGLVTQRHRICGFLTCFLCRGSWSSRESRTDKRGAILLPSPLYFFCINHRNPFVLSSTLFPPQSLPFTTLSFNIQIHHSFTTTPQETQ